MRRIFFFYFVFLTFLVFAVQETLTNGKEEHSVPVEIEKIRDAVVKILVSGYVEENNNNSFKQNKRGSHNSVIPQLWVQVLGTGFGNRFCNKRKDCGH